MGRFVIRLYHCHRIDYVQIATNPLRSNHVSQDDLRLL